MTTKPFLGPVQFVQSAVSSFEGTTGVLASANASLEDLIEDIGSLSWGILSVETKILGVSFDDLPLSEKMKHWGPMYGPLGPGRKTRR